MNSLKIAAALRVLANAFESDEDGAQPAAEPVKRGRGRPVKGEETGAAAPAAVTSAAQTAAAVPAAATAPVSAPAVTASDDPFATPLACPTATLDEVRAALTALKAAKDQDTALGVLKAHGGAVNLANLTADKYGAVVVAAKALIAELSKPAPVEADPFEMPAATPAVKLTLEDIKAAAVAAQKRTSQDTVQKVVMAHGGKAALATGGEGPSLSALPEANYAATIAALKALPSTK